MTGGIKRLIPRRRWLLGMTFFSLLLSFFSISPALANNLTISNLVVQGQDTQANTVTFEMDLSWENSWRDATNYDAMWLFMKYSVNGGGSWGHVTMKYSGTNPSGFSTGEGTPADLIVPPDKKGCFIQRSVAGGGSGTMTLTAVRVVWDYGADGVSDTDAVGLSTILEVFGVEMVYVPQGNFYAGDGTVANITGQFENGSGGAPLLITSEGQLTVGGGGIGSLGNRNASGMAIGYADDFNNAASQTLPAQFPKGYSAIYAMKYEISEGMYTAFLNTLTRAQQAKRVESNISNDSIPNIYVMSNNAAVQYRNTIMCPATGNGTTLPVVFSTARPDRACTYLSWPDFCAVADWAALRPMTELEYEKTARGKATAVQDEYPWGTTGLVNALTIDREEDGTEEIMTAGANCAVNNAVFAGGDGGQGALRTGIFAAAASTRAQAGAGFYGSMELGGNTAERVVSVGSAAGRTFSGTHGDGILTTTAGFEGNATNVDWPGIDATASRGVTGSAGSGYRGGSWSTAPIYSRTSDRYWASYGLLLSPRDKSFSGGRAVRTAS